MRVRGKREGSERDRELENQSNWFVFLIVVASIAVTVSVAVAIAAESYKLLPFLFRQSNDFLDKLLIC